jgi:hypothetical protein
VNLLNTLFAYGVFGPFADSVDRWDRERKVLRILRRLARQHVVTVARGSWVVYWALERDENIAAALATATLRGWVEPVELDVPWLAPLNAILRDEPSERTDKLYRLTEGGWAALNRAHVWTLVNTLLAAGAIVATVLVAM